MKVDHQKEYAGVPQGSLIILCALVGSTVHGTSISGTDDRDEMAICIEPPEKVVGLKHFETSVYRTQPEGVRSGPGDLDLVIHTLRKYTRLAARGNPTILLPLFVPEKDLIGQTHAIGRELRERRSMFLSKRAGLAFLGYLHDQRKRLTGERGQMRVTRAELIEQYGFDTKYAGHAIRLAHQGIELMTSQTLSLPMQPEQAQEVIDVRTGKYTLPEVLERARSLEESLRAAIDSSELPDVPNESVIDEFVVTAYMHAWRMMGR